MPKISTYTTVTPQGDDKIIVTQTSGTPSNVTKNVTVDGLKTFVNANVSGTVNTIPIFTGAGTLGDSQLSFDGNNSFVVAASTKFKGTWIETTAALALNGTPGSTGQVATSSGSIAEWVTPPLTFNTSSATGIESATNTASGQRSTAMGESTTASGESSTAMGSETTASGRYSTAMGYQTEASGESSTVMGSNTEASGNYSTAMGSGTEASGQSSTAMGESTTASGFGSTAIGQHNVLNSGDAATSFDLTNTALSIGNGTSSAAKSDAFSVLFNGNTTAAGSVTAESLNIAALNTAPVSATAPGTIGEIKFTADHIYVCVAIDTWKSVPIVTPGTSTDSLIWSGQLFQTANGNPSPQALAINTLEVTNGSSYRDVSFTRTGVGQYKVRVEASLIYFDSTKLSIMFGDSICRVTGKTQGSSGSPVVSYREWTFETPGFDGVLSDGLLLGNNGGYLTITLYS
tara:strand:+ start:87 stop:1466 length:1380 start_codon:yes stop_codon:yes gene_type:complete